MELDTTCWQVPSFESSPSVRAGWVEEQIQEGEGFLEGQTCFKNLGANLRVFDAIFRDKSRSTLITNELKYDIRKFCETLAEVREIAAYGSDFPAYKKFAEMLTKVSRAVYLESDFPFQILKVLQYASVMGIGYLWPKVRADEYGYGERKIVFEALGLLDVVPVQIPRTNDVQDAYAVTIYDYMPIAEAHGRFPLYQGLLQTVGPRSYKTQTQARRLDYAERYRYGEQGRSFGNLYTEIRYTFIRDLRINNTGFELPMGDPNTSWFYKVPYVGQMIFGGMRNGMPYMRPGSIEDCRVYPNLRLIITSAGLDRPMYDGPAFDWDGKMPVIQYVVDDWAWEPMGRSLVGDVGSIEITTRKIERKIDQVITATLNPPIGYDHTATGGAKIEHFDIFEEDVRYGVDGEPKKIMQSILPEEVRVNSEHFKFLEYLKNCKQSQLGLQDLGNLQNIKMNLANETADKMLESIGPIAKGIAARIEKANKAIGERMKFLILQWFNVKRVMEYVGPDQVDREVFDFNPDDLVPSHMPDELIGGNFPPNSSQYDRLTRARWFAKQIRLVSVPSTLLRITQMQEQMKYLQLKRGNAPISWATVMKKLDVPNYGDVPGNTEREKWFNEEIEMQKLKIIAAAAAQQLMQQLGIQSPQEGGGKGGGEGKGSGGRPPSGAKAPQLKQKGSQGGTPRTVVSES
jgi:hypothetical protein